MYDAGAVTVNPYLGGDSLAPFLERSDRGIILLCRTSNPGGADIQNVELSGGELFEHVARMANSSWNTNNNIGLVVGATRPEELPVSDRLLGQCISSCGVGAQGGDVAASLAAGAGGSLIIRHLGRYCIHRQHN